MTVVATKDEARRVENDWNLLRGNDTPTRKEFIDRFTNDTAFYFHQQFTRHEKKRKTELKQLDIPIDRVRPIIRRIVAKIVKNKPMIAALSADLSAVDLSRRVNAQAQYCMRISKGLSQIRRTLMNAVRGGLGWIEVYVDNRNSTGELEVKIRYRSPINVFVDFATKDTLFDDARNVQIIEKVMLTEALKMFPQDKQAREKLIVSAGTSYQNDLIVDDSNHTGGITVGSTIEQSLDKFNELDDDGEDFGRINGWVELLTTYRKVVKILYWGVTEDANKNVMRFRLNNKEELVQAQKQKNIKIEHSYETGINKRVCSPMFEMSKEQFNWTDHYSLVPFIWEDTENPYPVSETFFIRGHQTLQNKYYEIILLNAQTVSQPTVFFETGALQNKDKAANDLSTPGSFVEFNAGALRDKKVLMNYAAPLNQAFFTLYEQLKHEQEVQASAPSFQSGDASQIPETNKALVNLDNFADRPLAINTDAIEAALERVFKIVIQYQSVTYTDEKLLLIDTKPENNIIINQAISEVNDEGQVEVKKIDNDITKIDFDLQIVPGSMNPLDRISEYQYALQAVQLGVAPEFALSKMPVTGIDEEIAKLDTMQQLKQQNQQLMEGLEKMDKEIEKLSMQKQKAKDSTVDAEYRAKYEIAFKRIEDLRDALKREVRNAQRKGQTLDRLIQKTATAEPEKTADN